MRVGLRVQRLVGARGVGQEGGDQVVELASTAAVDYNIIWNALGRDLPRGADEVQRILDGPP